MRNLLCAKCPVLDRTVTASLALSAASVHERTSLRKQRESCAGQDANEICIGSRSAVSGCQMAFVEYVHGTGDCGQLPRCYVRG